MKKYKLVLTDVKMVNNVMLYRIQALRNICPEGTAIAAGTLGGYVQAEKNLSQAGECWLSDDAVSSGKAEITGNAWVRGTSVICGRAKVDGQAIVTDSKLSDCAKAIGTAVVTGATLVGVDTVKDCKEPA